MGCRRWSPVGWSKGNLRHKKFKIEVPRNGISSILRPSQCINNVSLFFNVGGLAKPPNPPRSAPAIEGQISSGLMDHLAQHGLNLLFLFTMVILLLNCFKIFFVLFLQDVYF